MQKPSPVTQWLRARWLEILLGAGLLALVGWMVSVGMSFMPERPPSPTPAPEVFTGEKAYKHVLAQVALGPRPVGSDANWRTGNYIIKTLRDLNWTVETQEFDYQGRRARNIIGRSGAGPITLVGAHYDTRSQADNDLDPEKQGDPVLGANDGASGVGVLLELARVLNIDELGQEIWLVFFDAEDEGGIEDQQYIVGSRYFASNLKAAPERVIIVDMIGDADQQIFKEQNSSPGLQEAIWTVASELGYGDYFIPEHKYAILDDHIPFLERGIPAVDIIDFDYPYWHTTQDTADKVSAEALERVGRVLETFLESR